MTVFTFFWMSRASQATSPILRRFAALSQSFSTSSKPSTPRIRLETKKPISKPPQLIISNQQTMDRRRHRPQIESHAMLGLQVVGTPIQASSSQATPSTSATVSPSVQLDNANAKSKPTPPKTHFQYYYWYEQAPNTRLVYIRDHTQADLELAQLKPGLLGFDLEWKPVFVKGQKENPVALVQLAGEDTILLIQVSAMERKRLLLNMEFFYYNLTPW